MRRTSLPSPLPPHDDFDRTPSLTNSDETTTTDSDYFISLDDSSVPTRISFTNVNTKSAVTKPLPVTPRPKQKEKQKSKSPINSSINTRPQNVSLIYTICQPHTLNRLLDHLSWQDFHALILVSKEMQQRLWRPGFKDLILSHFIPGYSKALRIRDARFWADSIQLTFKELEIYS